MWLTLHLIIYLRQPSWWSRCGWIYLPVPFSVPHLAEDHNNEKKLPPTRQATNIILQMLHCLLLIHRIQEVVVSFMLEAMPRRQCHAADPEAFYVARWLEANVDPTSLYVYMHTYSVWCIHSGCVPAWDYDTLLFLVSHKIWLALAWLTSCLFHKHAMRLLVSKARRH